MLPRSPTPSSTLRTLVLAAPERDVEGAWTAIEATAFAAGAREVSVAGRALFVFAQPIDALRFCLDLPQRVPRCRVAVHVGDLLQHSTATAFVASGAPPTTCSSPGHELLEHLLAGCAPGQRLLSRPAAALIRRASQGQPVAMPDGWDCQIGNGESALPALSLDPLPRRAEDAAGSYSSRQPLPTRPHWWLERTLPDAGPLQRAVLRNHKSGLRALMQVATDADGLALLQQQRDALQLPGVASLALEVGDGQLATLPAYLVCELGSARSFDDWWAGKPPQDQSMQLLVALAEALDSAHAAGGAHGEFDLHAIALGDTERVLLCGLQSPPPARLGALQKADCRAFARLLYGVLAGEPSRALHPFWRNDVDSDAIIDLLRRCLDPAHPQPIDDMSAVLAGLREATLRDTPAPSAVSAQAARRSWWSRRQAAVKPD